MLKIFIYNFVFLIAAVSLQRLFFRASTFYHSKNLKCIGALSFWSSDFGHAETRSGAKKRVVLRRKIDSL